MTLLIVSFIAGILTVLAPCILPILPVVIGRSAMSTGKTASRRRWVQPLAIVGALAVSVFVFSLLLKASTAFLGVPQATWQIISGGIITTFGLLLLFPHAWARLAAGLSQKAGGWVGKGYKRSGIAGSIVIGLALGPVFNSCSPTYALIVASILPVSFAEGIVYLLAYTFGLAGMLLLIAFAGQGIVRKLGWLTDPKGWFHKAIAVLFIAVGLMVLTGFDKELQAFIIEQGWYAPLSGLEEALRR